MYFCCTEHRRELLRRQAATATDASKILNGIDFLEVDSNQRILRVHFVNSPAPAGITADNVEISGGVRVVGITALEPTTDGNIVTVPVSRAGDYSSYTLRFVNPDDSSLTGLDPQSASVTFSFKVECESEFDCRPVCECPADMAIPPEIDYLAKDYASFRRLMLDRMSLLLPQWTERNPADLGVALVELLAYLGDQLSYRQDAVATEAYLETARQRSSVRRHARLVDYRMHDGCNARAWIAMYLKEGTIKSVTLEKGTRVLLATAGVGPLLTQAAWEQLKDQDPLTFETMADVTLLAARNEFRFHTFGDSRCCLPRGSTRAAIVWKPNVQLNVGDLLVFQEKFGPTTGNLADADPEHRQAVRLTCVTELRDELVGVQYFDIEWGDDDALRFPLCLSAVTVDGRSLPDVSIALGNVVLADQGCTVAGEKLGEVPQGLLVAAGPRDCDPCDVVERAPRPFRFRPTLKLGPLTHAARFTNRGPAVGAERWDLDEVRPVVQLELLGSEWQPQVDLLESEEFSQNFVAEVDAQGRTTLRFGDDLNGRRPPAGSIFTATYRVGNGATGNVAAGALVRLAPREGAGGELDTVIDRVWNPLPASGGIDPESIEGVRQNAPFAYRVSERAVTEDDYARVAERHPHVLRAVASFRWTGSWRTVFVTAQRRGGKPVDAAFRETLVRFLDRFRMAGQDVVIRPPVPTPLELWLSLCVAPEHSKADVLAAVYEEVTAMFAAGRFTFAQPVYLSPILAAAVGVPGVRNVEITRFQRLGQDDSDGRSLGVIEIGRDEIATLDNDPNFPERGTLTLFAEGGR